MSVFGKEEAFITKFICNKVYADEFKPVHTREMKIDASYGNVNELANIMVDKRSLIIKPEDLCMVPNLIGLSDQPSDMPIEVNGGWGVNRYSFLMEITIESQDSTKNLYLSGYTDRDDLISLKRNVNEEIMLIFNDCITTKTTYLGGQPLTRLVRNVDILPEKTDDGRDATLRPSDCFTLMEGESIDRAVRELDKEDEYGRRYTAHNDLDITFQDSRIGNAGGRISNKANGSCDQHLCEVSNKYVNAALRTPDVKNKKIDIRDEAITDVVSSLREPSSTTSIEIFKMLWENTNEVITNNVQLGELLRVAPFRFATEDDFHIIEGNRDPRDIIEGVVNRNKAFGVMTSENDTVGTDEISVEMTLAQMALQETVALMGMYKITRIALSATNLDTKPDGSPIIIIESIDSIVSNMGITRLLKDSFEIAFRDRILNKISKNGELAVQLFLYVSYSAEKLDLSIEGGDPLLVSLPKFMSNAFTPIIGSTNQLRSLAQSYTDTFEVLDNVIKEIKNSNTGRGIVSAYN